MPNMKAETAIVASMLRLVLYTCESTSNPTRTTPKSAPDQHPPSHRSAIARGAHLEDVVCELHEPAHEQAGEGKVGDKNPCEGSVPLKHDRREQAHPGGEEARAKAQASGPGGLPGAAWVEG